jgi:hypothetical protein
LSSLRGERFSFRLPTSGNTFLAPDAAAFIAQR